MKVFHGSYTEVSKPSATAGRRNLDFGRGFYITSLEEQAIKWAHTVAERKGPRSSAFLNEYNFDYDLAISQYKLKCFNAYDLEWLEYVVACRRGDEAWQQYDIIEGGVANDNVIDTVEDYENGRITADQALDQLKYKQPNHQICITSQSVMDEFLCFKKCIVLED